MIKCRKRIYYGVVFLILFFIEVCIALYFNDDFIRPYLGDILVTILVYYFIRVFIPNGIKYMELYVFMFAVCVEVLQYFQIVKLLGLENNTLAKIVIGSRFDWKDIICYGVGCIIVYCFNKVIMVSKIE